MDLIHEIIQSDVRLFLNMNGQHNNFTDTLSTFMSHKFTWIPLYAWLLVLLYKKYQSNIWKIVLSVILLIVLSDQGSNLLKNSIKRYRPCHNNYIAAQVHTVHNDCGSSFGFVSSHAANSAALAVFIILLLGRENKKVSILMIFYCLGVCWSRIMLGRHYPLDLLGGMMLGSALALLVWRVGKLYKVY